MKKKRKNVKTTTEDDKKKFKRKVLLSLITLFAGFILTQVIPVFIDYMENRASHYVCREEFKKIRIPHVEYKAVDIALGRFVKENLSSETKEIIKTGITVKETEHVFIVVNGTAKGKYINRDKKRRPGQVKVRICVDEILCGVDSDTFTGNETTALFSSATVCREMKPGEHKVSVVGIFSGPLEEVDAHLNYMLVIKRKKKLWIKPSDSG